MELYSSRRVSVKSCHSRANGFSAYCSSAGGDSARGQAVDTGGAHHVGHEGGIDAEGIGNVIKKVGYKVR